MRRGGVGRLGSLDAPHRHAREGDVERAGWLGGAVDAEAQGPRARDLRWLAVRPLPCVHRPPSLPRPAPCHRIMGIRGRHRVRLHGGGGEEASVLPCLRIGLGLSPAAPACCMPPSWASPPRPAAPMPSRPPRLPASAPSPTPSYTHADRPLRLGQPHVPARAGRRQQRQQELLGGQQRRGDGHIAGQFQELPVGGGHAGAGGGGRGQHGVEGGGGVQPAGTCS